METYFFGDFAPIQQNPCKDCYKDANVQVTPAHNWRERQTWGGPRSEAACLVSLPENEPGALGCVQRGYWLAERCSITAQIPRDIWGREAATHRSAGLGSLIKHTYNAVIKGSRSDGSRTQALQGSFETRKQNQGAPFLRQSEKDHAQADEAETKGRMTRTWPLPDWG